MPQLLVCTHGKIVIGFVNISATQPVLLSRPEGPEIRGYLPLPCFWGPSLFGSHYSCILALSKAVKNGQILDFITSLFSPPLLGTYVVLLLRLTRHALQLQAPAGDQGAAAGD